MRRICLIMMAFLLGMAVFAQKKAFQEAIKKGRVPTEFYVLRNDKSKMIRLSDVEEYAKENNYILGKHSMKEISRFGDTDESIAQIEFLPMVEYPSYIYANITSNTTTSPSLTSEGAGYLFVDDEKADGTKYLERKDHVFWSGNFSNGLLDGKGYGCVVSQDYKRMVFFEGTFQNGFPIGTIDTTPYMSDIGKYVEANKENGTTREVGELHEGLATFITSSGMGFIDGEGNIAIKPQFKSVVSYFQNGQAIMRDSNDKEVVIDKAGTFIDYSPHQKELDEEAKQYYSLGENYFFGNGVPQNYSQAAAYYKKGADLGNTDAQYSLGYCYYYGQGVDKDYAQAVLWFWSAAVQGHADAQYYLGLCYYNGDGVGKDFKNAVVCFRKAAEQGNASAQYNLGSCYYYGEGVTNDYAQAVVWYRKAAEQGNASAQYSLGLCYYKGEGVTQDYAQAVAWYRKAADQGDASAMCNLGFCYSNGEGVGKNTQEAVKWYRKAAEKGNAQAMYNLGVCYINGTGVSVNYDEAEKWYEKARSTDNSFVYRTADFLAKKHKMDIAKRFSHYGKEYAETLCVYDKITVGMPVALIVAYVDYMRNNPDYPNFHDGVYSYIPSTRAMMHFGSDVKLYKVGTSSWLSHEFYARNGRVISVVR